MIKMSGKDIQITLTGEPAPIMTMLQYLGRQPRIDDFAESKVYDSVEDYLATMPQEPVKCPGLKDRDILTTMLPKSGSSSLEPHSMSSYDLRQLVYSLWDRGERSETIPQILADEQGIEITSSQVRGMMSQRGRTGRRNVKAATEAPQIPTDAPTTEAEDNPSSQDESAVKGQMVPTETKAEILNVVHAPVVTPESQIPDIRSSPSKNNRWETPVSSDVDAVIDRLNKDGKSSREISAILSGQGINLTWQQVRGRIAYLARKGHNSPKAEVEPPKEQLPAKEPDLSTRAEPIPLTKRIIELDHQKMTPHTISDIIEEETGEVVTESQIMDIIIRNAKGML